MNNILFCFIDYFVNMSSLNAHV